MNDCEFNLLAEPWIRVMREDCVVEEVSLTDALIRSHEFRELSGELPTQNAAVLRLLLAILHAVFERVDAEGNPAGIEDSDGALDRWAELWQLGKFPEKPLNAYLEQQRDNFWLFHPERPFWQIPSASVGTEYEASKLNGELSESSNKIRLFPQRAGKEKMSLTYAEAARWLLYINAYDDTSAKPTKAGKEANGGKLPSPGAGWLGKIGLVYLAGDTLFETLMLNFVLLDNDGEPWSDCRPSWELEIPRSKERVEIAVPHDQAALLTLQSRRLILCRECGAVTGYHLLGGDFFAKENAFSEQMTVWGAIKDKKGNVTGFQPRRHDKSRQMWRDFGLYAAVSAAAGSSVSPGVIHWNALLQKLNLLSGHTSARLAIASVQYGDKDFFAADFYDDSLSVHANLLSELGEDYRVLITEEIARCDTIAYYLGTLANDLFFASGGDPEKKALPAPKAKEQYYYEIDIPFRRWLASLDAEDEDTDAGIDPWRQEAEQIARKMAEKMVRDAGPAAFVGKTVAVGKANPRYFSSSTAMQWFNINMSKLRNR